METQQEFEKEYTAIRGQLRLLRGKLDLRIARGFEQKVEGFAPAEQRNFEAMRECANRAISAMDRYEDERFINGEFEALTVRMDELAGLDRTGVEL